MAITLPESLNDHAGGADQVAGAEPAGDLTPREIVALLNKYIVGQGAAKRAVAIAIRNRYRRLALPADLIDEVAPKNILMIGPTGVGKTEISRRLSRLTGSPFLKVEASKFTEVGYVGRDVESMIRDLVDIAINMVRQEHTVEVEAKAREQAEDRLLDLLLPPPPTPPPAPANPEDAVPLPPPSDRRATREKLRQQLRAGELDERTVEVEVADSSGATFQIFTGQGADTMDVSLKDMLPGMFGGGRRGKRRKMKVPEALEQLARDVAESLVDEDEVNREALHRAEASGIVFLDELDKIAGREGGRGPDVSREGVQRDILPIVEGTVVKTRYGMIRTDHILFLAAGAFHIAKPSDLIPELQGRFPIRVELDALSREDLARILTEPENSLVRQYIALMATEKVHLQFTDDAVEAIAELAQRVNERTENIGARRLHTMLERVLEEISFTAPERADERIVIDAAYVHDALADVVEDEDLSKYIL